MIEEDEQWTAADVPSGPYLHGSRHVIGVGELLKTDHVDEVGGDDRQRACATTSAEDALRWAWQRKRAHGVTLYVYEVEMIDPEVDYRWHGPRREGVEVTSVMAEEVRAVRLVKTMAAKDYPASSPFPDL